MVLISKGDFLWIESPTSSAPIGARVVGEFCVDSAGEGGVIVVDDDGAEHHLGHEARIRVMHPSSVQGVEDLTALGDLHEAGILRNFHMRYRQQKLIYSRAGSILFVVNPYKSLPIYTQEQMDSYADCEGGMEMPPHIFDTASRALRRALSNVNNQCIVLMGESGAGKTTNARHLTHFFCYRLTQSALHRLQHVATPTSGHQMWDMHTVIEAFGNAKTTMNCNSSRHGKLISMTFLGGANSRLASTRIETLALEKTRVTAIRTGNDLNFHIFYRLFTGLSAAEKLQLELTGRYSDYRLLCPQGASRTALLTSDNGSGEDEVELRGVEHPSLQTVRTAMRALAFKEVEIRGIFEILAAILHAGNIRLDVSCSDDMTEKVDICDSTNVARAAKLLKVHESTLLEGMFTGHTLEKVLRQRDSLIGALYAALFDYVVGRMNDGGRLGSDEAMQAATVAVMDAPGFESFKWNGFEQICVNYIDERLQQYFTQCIFKQEQAEYETQGVEWRPIDFIDNVSVIDALSAQLPIASLFNLVDAETLGGEAGSDVGILSALNSTMGMNGAEVGVDSPPPVYVRSPRNGGLNRSFTINHYAGPVVYRVKGFKEKNFEGDALLRLESLAQSSHSELLKRMVANAASVGGVNRSSPVGTTAGQRLRSSIDSLLARLSECEPWFVRCIKPNDEKRALHFDRECVLRQLQCQGVLETTVIRKYGYPIHVDYWNFVRLYRPLACGMAAPVNQMECIQQAEAICREVLEARGGGGDSPTGYQLGRSRILLSERLGGLLESSLCSTLNTHATTIKKMVRGWMERRRFHALRWAAIVLQKSWRAHAQRIHYKRVLSGATRLQAILRSWQLSHDFNWLRSDITYFQGSSAFCRGALLRHQLQSLDSAEARREAMMARATGVDALDINDHDHVADELTPEVAHLNGHVAQSAISEVDFSPYAFEKFAAAYFESPSSSSTFRPLLHHSAYHDKVAARAVHICIEHLSHGLQLPVESGCVWADSKLGACGRAPALIERIRASVEELKLGGRHGPLSTKDSQSVITFENGVEAGSQQANSNGASDEDSYASAVPREHRLALHHLESILRGDSPTTLHVVQLITGHGIVRPVLRDEIYCQILHQISGSRTLDSRPWTLLALCAGCFACSPKLFPYLMCFLQTRSAPHSHFNDLISNLLRRTIANGTRCHPPSRVELNAIRFSAGVCHLNVYLADGTTVEVSADSASTVGEICREVIAKLGIDEENAFGFALYSCSTPSSAVQQRSPTETLDPSTHIMDILAEHEEQTNYEGGELVLTLRKEIFAPLPPEHPDRKAIDLIYHQLAAGIQSGEYPFEREEEVAMFMAQQHFITSDGAAALNVELLREELANFSPTIDGDRREKCVQLSMNIYRKRFSNYPNGHSIDDVKAELVEHAKRRWAMQFSRCFTAYKHSGPSLAQDEILIVVNSEGVYFVGGEGCGVLREFHFAEINSISCNKSLSKCENTSTITIRTTVGEAWVFQTPRTRALRRLLLSMIKMLSDRSSYLLAIADSKVGRSAKAQNLIEYRRGDLLISLRNECGAEKSTSERVEVENARTGMHGMVPARDMRTIPIVERPNLDLLSRLLPQSSSRREPPIEHDALNGGTLPRSQRSGDPPYTYPAAMIHTLERFASENFALPLPSRVNAGVIMTMHCHDQLWRHSPIPLERCLLKRLHGKSEAVEESLVSYTFLMRYMGDLPAQPTDFFIMPTDVIFRAPLRYEVLRDETYCQLMKQLTFNPNPLSEARGWELMWLCVGLFPPSKGLLPEVERFLLSHQQRHPTVGDCAQRLKKAVVAEGNRQTRHFPPHQVEVEAIRQRTTQIFHKVFLPDGREECVEVGSFTRADSLISTLINALGIKFPSGLSLFAKAGDRVVSMPDTHYFFDFIHQLSSLVAGANGGNAGSPMQAEAPHPLSFAYQIFFMRKLWIDVVPGEDPAADIAFHYNQELPKYLRGYYSLLGGPYRPTVGSPHPDTIVLTKQLAVRLAALVLKAQTPDDQKPPPFEHFQQHILREIVPKDIVRALGGGEWKRLVAAEFDRLTVKSASEAKIQFLRELAQFPTFGSAFFDVKQTSDPTMAARVVMAISQNGVSLYNHENLQHIVTYPFTSITKWQSGNTYFHFHTQGSPIKGGTRLLFETTLGYKMDDLMTSYIQTMLSDCQPGYGGAKNGHKVKGEVNGDGNGYRL